MRTLSYDDRSSLHCGRTNNYTIKWKGKELVLKPMTPQQIMAEQLQRSSDVRVVSEGDKEKNNLSAINKSVSESHPPKFGGQNKSEGKKSVLIATKSEMRDVRKNADQVLFVLLYKDAILSANDITSLPSIVANLL